jgi:hypothetical protein
MTDSANSAPGVSPPLDQSRPGNKVLPWKPIGVAVTSVGAPAGLGVLHPALGMAVFLIELAVWLIVLGTALFGKKEYSERAFRLLRWIANRPEPEAPPDKPMSGLPSGGGGAMRAERHILSDCSASQVVTA